MPELMTESSKEPSAAVEAAEESRLSSELIAGAVIRLMKHDISERFGKTRKLSAWDQEFCDRIDWHPVDEMPLKEEVVRELKKAEKEPHTEMTLDKLDKLMGLK